MNRFTKPTPARANRRRTLAAMLGVAAGAALLTTGCAVSVPAQIQPVRNFDVQRYAGQWYEIARIDHRFEKGLSRTTAQYSVNSDGTVKVVNRGYNAANQTWKESEGKARFLGAPDVAALKVSFFGPFYGGYNVVALDPQYQVAMVIGQSTDYFWLLSRQPQMPREQVQALLQKAQGMGVDLQRVIMVPQQ